MAIICMTYLFSSFCCVSGIIIPNNISTLTLPADPWINNRYVLIDGQYPIPLSYVYDVETNQITSTSLVELDYSKAASCSLQALTPQVRESMDELKMTSTIRWQTTCLAPNEQIVLLIGYPGTNSDRFYIMDSDGNLIKQFHKYDFTRAEYWDLRFINSCYAQRR